MQQERNAPWSEQKSRVFAGVTGRTLQRIEALSPEMRDPARQELAAIAELAQPLVHPAAYAAMQSALGPVWKPTAVRPGGSTMTRRMQPNKTLLRRQQAINNHWRPGPGGHCLEHDEGPSCSTSPRCHPVDEKPMPKLAEAVSALPAHGTDALTLKDRVLALVADTVAVPATGTVLVVDGVVQDVKQEDASVNHGHNRTMGDVTTYTFAVRHEPLFFEPGTSYTRFASWSIEAQMGDCTERFECTVIERDGSGAKVAFGRLTVPGRGNNTGADIWTTKREYHWGHEQWEAER
ncbi:hypothetical protein ACFCWY_19990 [Streptomyces sp. NPDC056362]|uniref:hypothetical protein n=1 Tax=unclassified Streptomyces TaxID=2593676 RepID=UPI0035DA3B37